MKKNVVIVALALSLIVSVSFQAQAAVVNSVDIGGFTTFQDLNTGRIWLDLNNFFSQSTTTMLASAQAAGFTFATRSDVQQLLNSLPLTSGEWPTYKSIMGDAPVRELIWGSYDDGGDVNRIGWAWSYSNDLSWSFQDNVDAINNVPNIGGDADLNLWAYFQGEVQTPIPEPATVSLLGLGLAGLFFRKGKKA